MKNAKRFGLLSLLLVAVLSLGLVLGASATQPIASDEVDRILNTTTDKSQITSPFTQAVNTVRDSVVGINSYVTQEMGGMGGYFGYGFRLPEGEGRSREVVYTGSGVVFSSYGHILTNYHVVENASRVTVTYGSKEAEATVVATDEGQDIAVLLVPGIDVTPVELGDSDQVQVGEWAIVIGNPLGQEFERTVTVGVVSAFDREVEGSAVDRYGLSGTVTKAMIQVDAAINSGNSGGGLFNTLGQLMGVPSLKFDNTRSILYGNTGATIDNIAMCLPINAAKPLIREALEKYDGEQVTPATIVDHDDEEGGRAANTDPNKPRMGVTVTTLNPSSSLMMQRRLPQGAYVAQVEENSPAAAAGLQPGDIIVEVKGTIITDSNGLLEALRDAKAGDQVDIKYYRVEGLHDIVEGNSQVRELGNGEYADATVELKVLNNSL